MWLLVVRLPKTTCLWRKCPIFTSTEKRYMARGSRHLSCNRINTGTGLDAVMCWYAQWALADVNHAEKYLLFHNYYLSLFTFQQRPLLSRFSIPIFLLSSFPHLWKISYHGDKPYKPEVSLLYKSFCCCLAPDFWHIWYIYFNKIKLLILINKIFTNIDISKRKSASDYFFKLLYFFIRPIF